MPIKLWEEFILWGSGFTLEGDRDYKQKGSPLIFHLKMYGLWYPDNYELVGKNVETLLMQAIKDGQTAQKLTKSSLEIGGEY